MTDRQKNRAATAIYAVVVFMLVIIVYFIINLRTMKIENDNLYNSTVSSQSSFVHSAQQLLANESSLIITDSIFIRDLIENNYLSQPKDTESLKQLEDNLASFIENKQIYDQIRYLDENGNEIIRIDLQDNRAAIYHDDDLQNKSDRYYFTDTMRTKYGQVYLSKFDLNMERGKIEIPIKPTVRIATKVNNKSGNTKGIVIANYYGNKLLSDFENLSKTNTGKTYLLNENSYYLRNTENSNSEFAFMYEDKKELNFSKEFPKAWRHIIEKPFNVYRDNQDIFISSSVIPVGDDAKSEFSSVSGGIVLGGGNWYVVSHLTRADNPNLFVSSTPEKLKMILYKNSFLIFAIAVLSLFLGGFLRHKHTQLLEEKFHSEFDAMTLAYNKRAGMEKIKQLIKSSRGTENLICLCFLDVNGLKSVNDTLGHEHGDALIKKSSELIISAVRNFDFLMRYGGDEFVLVLYKLNKEQANNVWLRIQEKFKTDNETSDRPYNISISHGFSFISPSETDVDLEAHIKEADENMYEEKKEIKKTVKILR